MHHSNLLLQEQPVSLQSKKAEASVTNHDSSSGGSIIYYLSPEELTEPECRSLGVPLQPILKIHIMESKSYSVARVPFEVIQQRPHEESPHVCSFPAQNSSHISTSATQESNLMFADLIALCR